jgi:glycosyltransferase involved in cell wall biosynthesis
VVIPAHNAERYIAASVRSALAAGIPEVEVLVVDDGSTDQTAAAVHAIPDPRITVISIAASGGPSRPRNIGIGQARAPYVSLLDADDLLKPGKLAASVAALERCPSAGFAFGDYEKIDQDGKIFESSVLRAYPHFRAIESQTTGEGWHLIPQRALSWGLLHENFIGTSGVVLRRELALAVGLFDEAIFFGEDADFWFRLAHRADALYCESIGHSYRVHSAGLSGASAPSRNAASRIRVLSREQSRWRERAARRQLDRRIANNLEVIGYQHRLRRERWQAVRSYLHACVLSPKMPRLINLLKAAFPPGERNRRCE